jgi:hypothetical protein
MALLGETVQGTRCNVQVRVGGTEGEEQDTGVKYTRQMLNSSKSDGKDEGRGGRSSSPLVGEGKLLGVVRDKHSQEEYRQAVEEQNPVEGELDGARNGLAGILGFANSYTDKLSTKVGEDGIDQRRPEPIELARVTRVDVLPKSTGLVPVLETSCVGWTGADSEKKGQNDNTDLAIWLIMRRRVCIVSDTYDRDDLYGTKPKFKFTKKLDAEIVDADNCDEEYGYPYTRIDLFPGFPFLDNQGRGCELIWRCDNVFAPISPAKRKSKSRVAEAGGITSKTRGVRDPSSHFTESSHDDVNKETDRSVSDENRSGTANR